MTKEVKDPAGQSLVKEAATPASEGRAKRDRKAPEAFKPEVKEKEEFVIKQARRGDLSSNACKPARHLLRLPSAIRCWP